MTMDDSKLENVSENKQNLKKQANAPNDKDKNNSKGKAKKKNSQKKPKRAKENEAKTEVLSRAVKNSDIFTFHEIADNKEASSLIYDLVKCFTSNSTLPQKDLNVLNQTLHEKMVAVILNILNNCVDKIFQRVLNTGFLNRKTVTKDAFCQTDVSYGSS